MRKTTKQFFLTAVAAACAASSVQAAYVPAGTQLAESQTLVRGNGSEPMTLDPQQIQGTPGAKIANDLFEGLVLQDEQGNIIPAQAESWTVSDDNRVFTFKIRKSAHWSNGEPVTAQDFVFGFKRAVDPALAFGYAWYMEAAGIENAGAIIRGEKSVHSMGVKALDKQTFQVTLEKPLPYFLKMLSHQTMFPAPEKVIRQYGEQWTRPGHMVSNGAYQLKSWTVNETINLERNPHYWNDKETVINKVTYLALASQNAELNRYKAGEVDMTLSIPLEHYKSLKKIIPAEIKTLPYMGTYYYEFNVSKPPFNDVRVRKALSYAINREALTNYVLGQGQIPSYTLTTNNVSGFEAPNNGYSQWSQDERMKAAKTLLKEAGYDQNHPLKFSLLYNTYETHKKMAIAVAQMWKPLGVQVSLENKEWKTFVETKAANDFELARAGWVGDYNEPSSMLGLKTTSHGQNFGKYSNPKFDQLIKKASKTSDEQQRKAIYKEAEKVLADDMPIAPVYEHVTSRLVKPYVGGYPSASIQDKIYTKDLYIKKH